MDVRRLAGWFSIGVGALFGALIVVGLFASLPASGLWTVAGLFDLLLPASLSAALVLVGWRLVSPRPEEARRERRRPAPVPVAPSSELLDVPEPISACPDCGFLGIRMPTIGDGLWPGGGETGDRMVCPRCDWQGLPARFETRADYREWLEDLHAGQVSEVA